MKFIRNTIDPRLGPLPHVSYGRRDGESKVDAWRRHCRALAGFRLGEPRAVGDWTAEFLARQGFCGVYRPEPGDAAEPLGERPAA